MNKKCAFFLFSFFLITSRFLPNGISNTGTASEGLRTRTPVLLIPGTSRTKLVDWKTGRVVWGDFSDLFSPDPFKKLTLPIDSPRLSDNRDEIGPEDILEKIPILPHLAELRHYTRFFQRMKENGYQRGDLNNPKPGDNFFIFLYDWRRSFGENTKILRGKIENLKKALPISDAKLDIIAHSSGVLIARHYALYGGRDIAGEADPKPDYAGTRNIRKLILINPVHQGTWFAFRILHEGFRPFPFPFIRKFTAEEIFSMPAFFELLPRYDSKAFVDPQGRALDISLYDTANWIQYGWSVFSEKEQAQLRRQMRERFPVTWAIKFSEENRQREKYLEAVLKQAKTLQKAVNEKEQTIPPSVESYVFVTDWEPTLEKGCLDPKTGKLTFGKDSSQFPLYAAGDGMATRSSLMGEYAANLPQYIFLREKHRRVANNPEVIDRILRILEGPGTGNPPEPEKRSAHTA